MRERTCSHYTNLRINHIQREKTTLETHFLHDPFCHNICTSFNNIYFLNCCFFCLLHKKKRLISALMFTSWEAAISWVICWIHAFIWVLWMEKLQNAKYFMMQNTFKSQLHNVSLVINNTGTPKQLITCVFSLQTTIQHTFTAQESKSWGWRVKGRACSTQLHI